MDQHNQTALIVLGGEDVEPDVLLRCDLAPDVTVVAADSGIDQALRLGVAIDLAVGDFDSVTDWGLRRAEQQGARVERHPVVKDSTDFELALQAVLELGATRVTVIGAGGGRFDHVLANALVMASPRYRALELVAHGRSGSRFHVVRGERWFTGEPGELVTLLAVHGPATGVTTEHLLYPLRDERLDPGSSRGVSNQMLSAEALVSVSSGVLLVVLPGPRYRMVEPPGIPRERR